MPAAILSLLVTLSLGFPKQLNWPIGYLPTTAGSWKELWETGLGLEGVQWNWTKHEEVLAWHWLQVEIRFLCLQSSLLLNKYISPLSPFCLLPLAQTKKKGHAEIMSFACWIVIHAFPLFSLFCLCILQHVERHPQRRIWPLASAQ